MKGGWQFSRYRLTLRHGRSPHGPVISGACLRPLAFCILCAAQLYCALHHRTSCSVLQPFLGVSSLTYAALRGGLFSSHNGPRPVMDQTPRIALVLSGGNALGA